MIIIKKQNKNKNTSNNKTPLGTYCINSGWLVLPQGSVFIFLPQNNTVQKIISHTHHS